MATYNPYQTTFTLSLMSNLLTGTHNLDNVTTQAGAEEALENLLSGWLTSIVNSQDPDLQACLGGWKPVWGPSVYVDPKDMTSTATGVIASATNVMFCAQNGSNYVVAIAGTNATSVFDQVTEDADAVPVKWAFGNPGKGNPMITSGNSQAIKILAAMPWGKDNQRLDAFLNALPDGSTITFTGHSLGGGLTPALATALFNQQSTINSNLYKRMSGNQLTVKIYPTAAPDIGENDYVAMVRTYFPAAGSAPNPAWQQWNQKIWNKIDVVPQVWSPAFAYTIDNIYGSNMTTPPYVSCVIGRGMDAIGAAFDLKLRTKDRYAALDPKALGQFTGTFVPASSIDTQNTCGSCGDSATDDLCDFFAEMLYQHTAAYVLEWGLSDVMKAIHGIVGQPQPINYCQAASGMYQKNILLCRTKPKV